MSFDANRLSELQGALRTKMANNKEIADSFKIEEGTVIVSSEQKSAFDSNMRDIREIKSLIEGLESMREVEAWGSQPQGGSVAEAAAAQGQWTQAPPSAKSLGQAFLDSTEFKALGGGKNGANMPAPFQVNRADVTGLWSTKDMYSALPSGTPGSFGSIQRDPIVIPPIRTKRVRDLFPSRTTTAAVV
jgi:hypothetical protein